MSLVVQLAKSKRAIMCLLSNNLLHIVLLLLSYQGTNYVNHVQLQGARKRHDVW